MSSWLRIILAVVVAAHGIGHVLFLAPQLGLADWGQRTQSWLLGGGRLSHGVGIVIWSLALVGFLAAALGLFQEAPWWRVAAVAAAIISTAGLLLFWASPPGSPAISAVMFNVLLVGALLVLNLLPAAPGNA